MAYKSKEKLKEVAIWYEEHQRNCTDPAKRMEFALKTLENLIWLQSYFLEDLMKACGHDETPQRIIPESLRHRLADRDQFH